MSQQAALLPTTQRSLCNNDLCIAKLQTSANIQGLIFSLA